MTAPESIRKAVDEAVAPLQADHKAFQADADSPMLPVSRAELHYVFDQYGDQLLDFSAEMMPVGHSHPFVVAGVKEHMQYYTRTAQSGRHVVRWPVEYARQLSESFVEDEDDEPVLQALYTEGEREAVLTAIRLARDMSTNTKIAMIDTDEHSWISLHNLIDHALLPIDEFHLADFAWQACAAILISPVTYDGRVLEARWLQSVVNYAKQYGVTVIFDESRAGFGRLGSLWAQHALGVNADITVLGGPVGGGLPLGVVLAPKEVFEDAEIDVSRQAGSPVACAAGANTLRAINPGVVEHAKEAGGVMDDALMGLISQFPEYVVATHGQGLWRVLEFQSEGLANGFQIESRRHGLLVPTPVGSSLLLTPTLICSEQEIKRGVDLIGDVLLDWAERDSSL